MNCSQYQEGRFDSDLEIANNLSKFHHYLEEGIVQAMFESSPECCPYCQPIECETAISPGIKHYVSTDGLKKDIQRFYTHKLTKKFYDLLREQRDIKSYCKKYTGPEVYPFFVLPINVSCSHDKPKELCQFSDDLFKNNLMIPEGTPVILLEYDYRPIHHGWYNVLEDVKWYPYAKWKKYGQHNFHERNLDLQAITHKLWDKAMDKQVEEEEHIVYIPPTRPGYNRLIESY